METKYRGKTKEGKWVYGYYVVIADTHYISSNNEVSVSDEIVNRTTFIAKEVIPETVGMFTGLKDKKRTKEYPEGQEVYEGDIVKRLRGVGYKSKKYPSFVDNTARETIFLVQWNQNYCGYYNLQEPRDDNFIHEFEVIGNQTDNPELLE